MVLAPRSDHKAFSQPFRNFNFLYQGTKNLFYSLQPKLPAAQVWTFAALGIVLTLGSDQKAFLQSSRKRNFLSQGDVNHVHGFYASLSKYDLLNDNVPVANIS